MRVRTKIVCTMGPAVGSLEKKIALIEAGMSVARINFSHGTHDEHRETIHQLKEARKKTGQPLAIMLDTKGPEIRVGKLDHSIQLKKGDILKLVPQEAAGGPNEVPVIPASVLPDLQQGAIVLFDDGYIATRVVQVVGDEVMVEVQCEGELKGGKGINVPNVALDLPMITDRDYADITFGAEQDVDLVAASFVQTPEQVLAIKRLLVDLGRPRTGVISKIESSRGVKDFDQILAVSDGIMIARGDLGVEVPLAQVPSLQKMMIRRCYEEGKPSIVATQMLESMMTSPRPTRAEASDVANAIYDSGSAVMLSGETAIGRYPIETVETMRSIMCQAEQDFDYDTFYLRVSQKGYGDVPSAVSLASLKTAISAGAKAIFVLSSGGRTPRLLSRLRPPMPIITLTPSEKIYHQLAFNWGVIPVLCPDCSSLEEGFETLSKWALEHGHVQRGDLVVVTAGVPFGITGTTNTMVVQSIGDVLVRGNEGMGARVHGDVVRVYDPDKADPATVDGKIMVLARCNDKHMPLLKSARGIVLQNHVNDHDSANYLLLVAKALDLSVLTDADAAMHILKDGKTVTLDPSGRLVYNGILE